MIKFAKYQINFCILPTFSENFIGIKQVWPQQQPQRYFEVKLQIYTLILFRFHDRASWKKALFYSQRFDSNNLKDFWKLRVSNREISFEKNKFTKAVYFTTKIQKHCRQISWIHYQLMCKFWFWPWFTSDAVSEAIPAWSQWNF